MFIMYEMLETGKLSCLLTKTLVISINELIFCIKQLFWLCKKERAAFY